MKGLNGAETDDCETNETVDSHTQPATELFQLRDMRPYDPTQEIIFPPELKVK